MVGPNQVEGGEKEREKEREEKRGEEERRGVRSSNFSLDLLEIGPSVQVEARGKVGPCIKSYAWVPKSMGFIKLREVGFFFHTQLNSCLRAIQMDGVFRAGTAAQLNPEILGLNA